MADDIPSNEATSDAFHEVCADEKYVAAAAVYDAAKDLTKAELTAAGEFSAGAGIAAAIEGNRPAVYVADVLSTGFLNPTVQETTGTAAGIAAGAYTEEHWGGVCDGIENTVHFLEQVPDNTVHFLEQVPEMPPGSLLYDKLGYIPGEQPVPTFETPTAPAEVQPAYGGSLFSDAPTLPNEGPSWGLPNFTDPVVSSANESNSNSGDSNVTAAPSTETSSTSSLFGGLGSWDSSPNSGSLFGSQSESPGSSGWGDSGSSSHSDGGSTTSFSDSGNSSSSSSSHDSSSGSASMDGGL